MSERNIECRDMLLSVSKMPGQGSTMEGRSEKINFVVLGGCFQFYVKTHAMSRNNETARRHNTPILMPMSIVRMSYAPNARNTIHARISISMLSFTIHVSCVHRLVQRLSDLTLTP